jgi:AraC-like DNA-binding protein
MAQAVERVEWHQPADLPGVEILLADHCAHLWRVYHETYTACTLLDCRETVWAYRRKIHSAAQGGIMLMEPGEIHVTKRLAHPVAFRVLLLKPALVDDAAHELDVRRGQPPLKGASVDHPRFFEAFAGFHESVENGADLLEKQSRLAACVRLFLEHCTESRPPPGRRPARAALLRVRDYVREHHADNLSLSELCAVSGLSRYHLVRAFAAEFGLPPHAYQTQVRLSRARSLIQAGAPLSAVAAATGFADQSHLTRHFRAQLGLTPRRYLAVA